MLKIIRYVKPYTHFLLLSLFFLFVQAMSELALPDYMSRIVNTGIQQGGIEHSVPTALRKTTLDHLALFMTDDEKSLVFDRYTVVKLGDPRFESAQNTYPILKSEPIALLNDPSDVRSESLSKALNRSLLIISGIEKAKSEAVDGMMDLNGTKISVAVDPYRLIALMGVEKRQEMVKGMDKMFTALGESMVHQGAVAAIKAEYTAMGVATESLQNRYIVRTGLLMLAIALLAALSTITVVFLSAKIGAGVARDLRQDVFSKIEGFSLYEFDRFSTASLITRTTNDITQIQMVTVMIVRMVFFAPIMGIGGIIRALDKSVSMSWIIALAVIILLGLISVLFAIAVPKFKKIQLLIDRLNLGSRENLSGLMVIRAFVTQDFEEERFEKVNRELTKTTLFIGRMFAVMMPLMMVIMNGIMLLIIWVGAHQIAESSLQVGDMMAFMQYAMHIIFSFLMLSMMFIMLPRAAVSAGRISEVLETEPTIKDPREPIPFPQGKEEGVVEFQNVSFRFPGAQEDMLKNISFTALPGKTTAIIGSTGSGKSTLLNLIPRFFDVTEGQVLVDGVDVRQVTQKALRSKIGYVPQKGLLFSGTIEFNLKYANAEAAPEDMETAAQIAQASEFIEAKPDKYQEHIAQAGANVSGGQKQRLSIARALMKKAPIYLFDDSFSALDYKTDMALRRQLQENTASSTVIIVGQRIATIMNADQILVLDEGRIVGHGTHRELIEHCKTYQEIAYSQLTKEELA